MSETAQPEPEVQPLGPPAMVNGVAVVAREPAIGPHPMTKVPTPFRGVERVLLADGKEIYWCTGAGSDCYWVGESTRSVASHRSGAHRRPRQPRGYRIDTIKAVIREVLLAKREPGSNYALRAADQLNERGLKTANGKMWTSDNVSRIYNAYAPTVRVRLSGRPRGISAETAAANGQPPEPKSRRRVEPIDLSLLAKVNALLAIADQLRIATAALVEQVEAGQWDAKADPILADKAARWDQMQALMGGR